MWRKQYFFGLVMTAGCYGHQANSTSETNSSDSVGSVDTTSLETSSSGSTVQSETVGSSGTVGESGTTTEEPTTEEPTTEEPTTEEPTTEGPTTEPATGASTVEPDLPQDQTCEGLVTYEGFIEAFSPEDLEVLDGVECLVGYLSFWAYESTTLKYIQNLQIINGSLSAISTGPLLKDLQGLESLHTITSNLAIVGTDFQSLAGLNGLTSVSEIQIYANSYLGSLEGLNSLQIVDYTFYVGRWGLGGNPSLNSLKALSKLEMVGDDFYLHGSGVTDLQGLEDLSIGGILEITDNPHLPTCVAIAYGESKDVVFDVSGNLPDECGG